MREDDIWICTFPKSGTTWTQELVWMLVNDVDEEAAKVPLNIRSPHFEGGAVLSLEFLASAGIKMPDELEEVIEDPIEYLNNLIGRRVIKTHLPFELLPPKLLNTCKVD